MRVIDAFCGVGGMSCGFLRVSGVKVILGIENNDKILRAWASNTGGRAVYATIGIDEIIWPEASPDIFVHLSPPCTALSKARAGSATKTELDKGLGMLRWCIELVVKKGYLNFSLENVSTAATRAVAQEYAALYPSLIAFGTFDSADFDTPQNRLRLIISNPNMIRLLKETPVTRLTVANAFKNAGLALPGTHIKSNTNNRDGTPCMRSVHQQSFTVTSSHPLTWADAHGTTVRCLNVHESAILMGFTPTWKLPAGSRLGIHAVGNAVPPPMATAIMRCAVEAARAYTSPTTLPSPPIPPHDEIDHTLASQHVSKHTVSYKKFQSLKRRVDALEAHVLGAVVLSSDAPSEAL
jgi:site-specific DNA-cytosine methylase